MPNQRRRPKAFKLCDELARYLLLESSKGRLWAGIPLSVLNDPKFARMPDEAKGQLLSLMLYVKQLGFNHLPNDPEFLSNKINATSPLSLDKFRSLGFLIEVKRKRTKAGPCAQQNSTDHHNTEQAHTDNNSGDAGKRRAVGAGSLSTYSYDDCLRYARHLASNGGGIKNPGGFARSIHRSGEHDAQIRAWLDPVQTTQADPSCPKCFGSGMETVKGKGARRCECIQRPARAA